MRLLPIASLMIMPALWTQASARPLERELPPTRNACWERTYDAGHLARHPGQKVTRVRLVHVPADQPGGPIYVALYFKLRAPDQGKDFDFQLGGLCRAAGQALRCQTEWDVGSWRLERGPGGTLDVRNAGIIANPNPYDAEEIADGAVRIPARPDDGTWRLSPAAGRCEIE